jgi:hypothetical protein
MINERSVLKTISIADFDLDTWYKAQGLSQGQDLTVKYTHILYNDLNLSPYIGEPCLFTNSSLNVSSLGWANGNA